MTPLATSALAVWPLQRAGAVLRHELRSLLYSPLTYVFQIGFLTVLAICTFLIADYYSTDEASIQPMLVFLPWVALILVPALAMRAWTDEPSDRGIELMLTLPITLPALVAGKFLAGYLILLLTLLFTTPLVATAYYLGSPDPGVIASSYLAAALLLGTYYAIALFASSLAREPVGAFVVGVTLLFAVLLLGWDVFARLLQGRMPAAAIEWLALYSPKTWLDNMARGRISFGGLVYFSLVMVAALAATAVMMAARRYGATSAGHMARSGAALLLMLGGLALAIPLAERVPFALDLTAEREFSLHAGTQEILHRLPTGVEATLYWSASESSVPVSIKSQARRIQDLLRLMAENARGRLTVRVLDPKPDTDEESTAIRHGVRRVPMSSGDHFYLGASFSHGRRVGRIPYFDIRREGLVEYDIAVALNALTRERTPRIGVISSMLPPSAALEEREGLSFMAELKRAYDVAVIPYFQEELPAGLDVVLLINTPVLRRSTLYAIDQFLMKGGSVVAMLDPFVRHDRGSNRIALEPSAEVDDISDLLLAYGVRYQGKDVVGDAAAAAAVADEQQVRMSFPYWLRLGNEHLSSTHPVTAALSELFFVEPGELLVQKNAGALPLVSTSDESGARAREDFTTMTPRELALGFKPDGRRRVIAAALRGSFKSAFSGPLTPGAAGQHLERSPSETVLFVIADVDWLFDPFSLQKIDLGGQVITRPLNDNLSFLLNMLEYASGEAALISIRSRGQLRRAFTRVAELFKAAEKRYRDQEAKLAQQISELERRIAALTQAAGVENPEQLPDALKTEVRRFQLEGLPMRQQLREIRRRIREEVEDLGRRLTVINLLAGPLCVSLFAAMSLWLRRRRHRLASRA